MAGVLTLVCSLLSIAMWIPAESFRLLAVFAVLAGAVLGVFWMVIVIMASIVVAVRVADCFVQPQTIGPLCVVVAGLKHLQSLLSLSWITIILPTTCDLPPTLNACFQLLILFATSFRGHCA